ncbi:MAG: response regulator transcription factor [Betaproteobacteria bacterium]|nr:response regulator transcription factor [Betaproteobacteria bacterium]
MNFLIVDDHPLIRRGIRQILEEAFPESVVDAEGSCETALPKVREQSWDLIILDISLPTMGGLEFLDRIRRVRPGQPVLVLTMHGEHQFAVHAVRSGARGYVTKQTADEDLLQAVRRVLSGGHWVSGDFAEALLFTHTGRAPHLGNHQSLSPRELRVLVSIASGYGVTEIAGQLFLSAKTISTYRSRSMEKLDLHSNAELTRYCPDHRLVT